jgi:hypothetical protein
MVMCSVAAAQTNIFVILGNKIAENLKIFMEVNHLRRRGVSANYKRFEQQFLSYLTSSHNLKLSWFHSWSNNLGTTAQVT